MASVVSVTLPAYDGRMRIVSSELALRLVIALRQKSASLAELAQSLGVQPSSCQRALEVLDADQLISAVGAGRARTYVMNEANQALPAVEELALAALPAEQVAEIVGKCNPAVEFVGLTPKRLITVFAERSELSNRSSAAKVIKRSAHALNLEPQFFEREDLEGNRELRGRLRDELSHGEVLVGSVARSIRDPYRRTAGHALGQVSPALHLPSQRVLRSIKKRHGVRQLKIFGSAVRSDFRRESDVDIAVMLEPGVRASPRVLAALEAELETRLGHDVDLVLESQLRQPVRYLVEREAVAL